MRHHANCVDIEITDRSDGTVEVVASLVSTGRDLLETEAVTTFLEKEAGVTNVSRDGSPRN